jgi:hypothetical protein
MTNSTEPSCPEEAGIRAASEALIVGMIAGGGKKTVNDGCMTVSGARGDSVPLSSGMLAAALSAMADYEPQPHIADALRRYADTILNAKWFDPNTGEERYE